MSWLTHRVLRKEASFKLVPNERFNLELKTGIKAWNSPKFVISVNKYLSTYGAVDARCEIVESGYPNFYLSNVERMGAGSEITVYVIEGNEGTINYNPNTGWTETFRIKENTIYQYEINSGNNWTVPIPEDLIGKNFDILYSPKNLHLNKLTFGYEYISSKIGNNIRITLKERVGKIIKEQIPLNYNVPSLSKTYYNCLYLVYKPTGAHKRSTSNSTITININGQQYIGNVSEAYVQNYNFQSYTSVGWFCDLPSLLCLDKDVHIYGSMGGGGCVYGDIIYATTANYTEIFVGDFSATITLIKKEI